MNTWPIKGIDHPKMKMTPWFTHSQAIEYVYEFLLSDKHNQSYINKHPALPGFIMAVNGCHDFEAQKSASIHPSIINVLNMAPVFF